MCKNKKTIEICRRKNVNLQSYFRSIECIGVLSLRLKAQQKNKTCEPRHERVCLRAGWRQSPGCTTSEKAYRLEISDLRSGGIVKHVSKRRPDADPNMQKADFLMTRLIYVMTEKI